MDPTKLNPAQQRVLETLGTPKDQRPVFRKELSKELKEHLEESGQALIREATTEAQQAGRDPYKPVSSEAPESYLGAIPTKSQPFVLTKRKIHQLLGCQINYVEELAEPFSWSAPTVRGTLVHKAIEYSFRSGEALPVEIAANTMKNLSALEANDLGIRDLLCSLGPVAYAELENDVTNAVASFLDGFPPLEAKWFPQLEVRNRYQFCQDTVLLSAKVDLSLGRPSPEVSNRVIIDLKTGARRYSYIEDLRFYSLLETLRMGLAPRMVANYYLDEAHIEAEPVTEDLLVLSATRVLDALAAHLNLVLDPKSAQCLIGDRCFYCEKRNEI